MTAAAVGLSHSPLIGKNDPASEVLRDALGVGLYQALQELGPPTRDGAWLALAHLQAGARLAQLGESLSKVEGLLTAGAPGSAFSGLLLEEAREGLLPLVRAGRAACLEPLRPGALTLVSGLGGEEG